MILDVLTIRVLHSQYSKSVGENCKASCAAWQALCMGIRRLRSAAIHEYHVNLHVHHKTTTELDSSASADKQTHVHEQLQGIHSHPDTPGN